MRVDKSCPGQRPSGMGLAFGPTASEKDLKGLDMIGRTPRPGNIGEDALNNTRLLPETRERNVSTRQSLVGAIGAFGNGSGPGPTPGWSIRYRGW